MASFPTARTDVRHSPKGDPDDTREQWTREPSTGIFVASDRRQSGRFAMHDLVTYVLYYPVGIFIGSWLFFEIGRRM
jgi:hypothetical protein